MCFVRTWAWTRANWSFARGWRGYNFGRLGHSDASSGTTSSMRTKEDLMIIVFPEPDLVSFYFPDEWLNLSKSRICPPQLPREFICDKYGIWIALHTMLAVLTKRLKKWRLWFVDLVKRPNYKAGIDWMMGPISPNLNEKNLNIGDAKSVQMLMANWWINRWTARVSSTVAAQADYPELLKSALKLQSKLRKD